MTGEKARKVRKEKEQKEKEQRAIGSRAKIKNCREQRRTVSVKPHANGQYIAKRKVAQEGVKYRALLPPAFCSSKPGEAQISYSTLLEVFTSTQMLPAPHILNTHAHRHP